MRAQSPTLSPTLSAMTAGLRGSSSGMPASTSPPRPGRAGRARGALPAARRAGGGGGGPPGAARAGGGGGAVGGVREDAAAEAGEDGDERAAEAEADEGV